MLFFYIAECYNYLEIYEEYSNGYKTAFGGIDC